MQQTSQLSGDLAVRFDREIGLYRAELLARATRMTRNREDAEDLVQEALLRACGAFHRFEGDQVRAWLHRILTNAYINGYRRRQREPLIVLAGGADQLATWERAGAARSAETLVLDRMPAAEVLSALDGLPAEFRRALLLTDVEGFSCRETAELMGTPIGTVMSRLHRARAAVRARLTPARAGDG